MAGVPGDDVPQRSSGPIAFVWDTNTAVAVIVLGALGFLWLAGHGFRGFNVTVD